MRVQQWNGTEKEKLIRGSIPIFTANIHIYLPFPSSYIPNAEQQQQEPQDLGGSLHEPRHHAGWTWVSPDTDPCVGQRKRDSGNKKALWFFSRQGLFQQQPSLLGLTVICPLLLTCLFIRIVQKSFKLPGAFTISLGEDAQLLASAS